MKIETREAVVSSERVEQLSTLALIAGVIFVFQWSFQWLYVIGVGLLIVGSVGTFISQVMKKQPMIRILERMTTVGMMVGILGMLQSWDIWLYENGFYLLALSTLGFIIVSHISSPE